MLVAEAWYFNYVLPLLIRLRRGLIMLSGFAGRLMRWLALRAIMLKKHSALIFISVCIFDEKVSNDRNII